MNEIKCEKDFYKAILKDRYPSAKAKIIGEADEDLNGNVSFYKTPIGTIVSVEIYDVPRTLHEYTFSINCRTKYYSCDEKEQKNDLFLKSISAEDDYIWLATLSTKIDINEIVGHTMSIYTNEEKNGQKRIAKGIVV